MTNGYTKCANCGGDKGIHHYQTDQCPVGGREARDGEKQEYKTSTFAADIPFDPLNRLAKDMTIREYFAAMAMQGWLASAHYGTDSQVAAYDSVIFADALIAALNRPMCPDCKVRFADDGHYDTEHKICPDYERAVSEVQF